MTEETATGSRVRLVGEDAELTVRIALPSSIGWSSEAAYPMRAPYSSEGGTRLAGRVPRLLSIIFCTLVHTDDPCYDSQTRTLSLGGRFHSLCMKFGLLSGGINRGMLNRTMEFYATREFTTVDGRTLRPCEDHDLSARAMSGRWIRFTPEWEALLKENNRQVPLDVVASLDRSYFTLDLLMIAVLYAPNDRRLIIPFEELSCLLPEGTALIRADKMSRTLSVLNAAQSTWRYSLRRRSLSIMPANATSMSVESVTLRVRS